MKKFLFTLALVLFSGVTMAQKVELEIKEASTNITSVWSGSVSSICDGDPNSLFWTAEAQSEGKYLQVELVEENTVGDIILYFSDGDRPAGANVEISTDGTNWESVASFVTSDLDANNVFTCSAGGKTAKYVRMHITTAINSWLKVNEIEVCLHADILGLLGALVESANAVEWGTLVGTYEKTAEIESAISEAEAIVEAGTEEGAEEAFNTLSEALANKQLVMPDPTKYYTITSNSSQSGCTGRKIYVNNTGTMQFEDATTLANVFQFKEAETEGQFYIYCVDRDTYVNSNRPHGEGTNVSASGTETEAKPVVIARQGEGGKVSITPVGGAMLHAQAYGAHVVSYNATGANSGSSWTLTEVNIVDMAHKLAIGATGWATLYLPFNATKPADAELYMVTSKTDNNATLTEFTGDILPGDVPVLVKATASTTLDFKFTTNTPEDDETLGISLNMLSGSTLDEDVAEEGYVLANVDGVTGFYKALMAEGSFMNNAFKAYLPAEGAAGARLLFDFGTETAIESIEGAENADAVVYDLAGRRVKGVQKGLYIVNGKVVIK